MQRLISNIIYNWSSRKERLHNLSQNHHDSEQRNGRNRAAQRKSVRFSLDRFGNGFIGAAEAQLYDSDHAEGRPRDL